LARVQGEHYQSRCTACQLAMDIKLLEFSIKEN